MTISFELTRRDIFFATIMMLLQQPIFIGFFTLIFVFIAYQNLPLLSYGDYLFVGVALFCIFQILPILFVGGVVIIFAFLSTLSRRNKTMLSKQTILLTENLFVCESEFVKSEVKWPALQRIVRTRNYAFLYLSELGAMLIPKRAFALSSEWEDFIRFCREKSTAN